MKRSFDLLSGFMMFVILLLVLTAGWLMVSIADQEAMRNQTPMPWVTATFFPESNSLMVSPQPEITPTANSSVPDPAPAPTPLSAPALPAGHPTPGSQTQNCVDCHPDPHGGGG